jgi:haloalkane dehalogenase
MAEKIAYFEAIDSRDPGLFVTSENAAWAATNKNIDTLGLGPGIFMLMEDNPHEIGEGEGVVKWFKAKVA